MDTTQSPESAARALIASAAELDPNSPEFYEACQALVKQSAARRQAAQATGAERVDIPYVPVAAAEAETVQQQPRDGLLDPAAESAALREARRRESEARAEALALQSELTDVKARYNETLAAVEASSQRDGHARSEVQILQAELANVKARYNETLAALEAASERASQARIEFGNAMSAIAERDAAINELRQHMADQDREINELQRLLIEAEEARIADASAILDSLDKYRP